MVKNKSAKLRPLPSVGNAKQNPVHLRYVTIIGLAACMLTFPGGVCADNNAGAVSKGDRFELKSVLKAEGTTVLLFINSTSAMEKQFLADLQKQLPVDEKIQLSIVRLKDTSVPAAQQYQISATPTAIRCSAPTELRGASDEAISSVRGRGKR